MASWASISEGMSGRKASAASVMSSRTPETVENSCSTPSIRVKMVAAPWRLDRSTRRSELPSVVPNPFSSGCT